MRTNKLFNLLAFAGILCSSGTAFAATLSPASALERALPAVRKIAPTASSQLKLTYTESMPLTDEAAIYVFSDNVRFIAVSADDRAEALLGYSDRKFDPDAMPPAMKWWLEQYARQIEHMPDTPVKAPLKVARQSIAPKITTIWNQDAPYNEKCPKISGAQSVTGCVATAMSQVMNYHKWPVTGTGKNSYRLSLFTNVSMDFSATTFDYANMLDTYLGVDATQEQKDAVATLMFACGVGVNMQYSSTESGASSIEPGNALIKYFRYDKSLKYINRDYYTRYEWDEYIYNQLKEYGPVLYFGQSNQGGHAFICDGYSNDGYFHFNWGWGGISDGYFLLSALDPDQQGIGGSLSGFNFYQSIVADLQKEQAGSKYFDNLAFVDAFGIQQTTARVGATINITGTIASYSYNKVTGNMGLKFVNTETGETTYTAGTSISDLGTGYGFSGYYLTLPLKTAGTYKLTPAFQAQDGTWIDVPVKYAFTREYIATVKSGRFDFQPVKPGELEVSDIELITKIYTGQSFHLTATMKNVGDEEYYAAIAPALLDASGKVVAIGDFISANLEVGESREFSYMGAFNRFTSNEGISKGDYTLCFVNTETLQPLSGSIEVTVNEAAAPRLSVTTFTIEGGLNSVDAANINFTGRVRCMGGYFGGMLDIAIFNADESDDPMSLAVLPTKPMFLSFGKADDFSVIGSIPTAKVGDHYLAALYNDMNQISNPLYFTIGKVTAVENIEAPDFEIIEDNNSAFLRFSAMAEYVAVYSIDGSLKISDKNIESIDMSQLAAGMYVIQATPADGSLTPVVKMIIKK